MKVLVWNENVHEKGISRVTELYPGGLHEYRINFKIRRGISKK